MSIRRYCRLKARALSRLGEGGQSLVMALMVMLVVLPMAIYFYSFINAALRASLADKHQKIATQIANDAVTDYFRQFSQDAYNGHYDTASLSRPEMFYSAGYSTVTFIPDSVNHTLYLRAEGVYGVPGKPERARVLEALVKFVSDLVRYGTMFNAPSTISASNVTYNGGFYCNGNLTVTGANVRFKGGPVVVNGDLSGASTIDGDLYYSGASIGGFTVTGNRYNFIPSVNWPALDFAYYNAYSTYITTTSRTIVFNSTGTFTVVSSGTYPIPASGAIIYASNANLTVSGVVSGLVTVVAGSTINGSCGSANGKIVVNGDLYYVGASSIAATSAGAFSALATNCITFSKTGSNLLAAGVYFVQNGTNNMSASGSAGRLFKIYGVRTQLITLSGFSSAAVSYDANLRSYQPPGLPEKAYLVNWNLHH